MAHQTLPVKNIIIPIEIQNREMFAKLYLGAVAATRGYNVVVGDQKEIVKGLYRFSPSLYLDKSVAKTKLYHFQKLKKLGHIPIALCEEGLVYRDTKRYLRERVDLDAMAEVSRFFCWGRNQRSHIEKKIKEREKLKIVGNPRFDLLRDEFRLLWEEDCRLLKEKYGRFILVNTNFSRGNRIAGTDDVIQLLKKRGTLDSEDGEEYYGGLIEHLQKLFSEFLKAIPVVAERFPSHTVIIRPHPGEDLEPYYELAEALPNVQVQKKGSVITWLLAAECVIHNSCTTGVEGWILGRPVISYMPVKNNIFDSYLPNEMSYKCDNLSSLNRTIDGLIEANVKFEKTSAAMQLAEEYIYGVRGSLAADALVDELPRVNVEDSMLARGCEFGYSFGKGCLRRLPGFRLSKGLTELAQQKFPGMPMSELNEFMIRIGKCRPELKNVSLAEFSGLNNVFYITPKEL